MDVVRIRHSLTMDKNAAIASGIATLFLLSATLPCALTARFAVGDQIGWIVPNSGLNYTVWAQNVTAHVGDSLYFQYNPNVHNVLKVNETTYATCNISAPSLQTWDNGDTTVMLEEAGTHYFICGAISHCVMGQAFALEVLPVPSDVTPTGPNVLSPPGSGSKSGAFSSRPHPWLVIVFSLVLFLYSS